ncbi:MAG: DUF4129 domain-containing transglutaminase family protein [Verrucomicrobiota bacterium]
MKIPPFLTGAALLFWGWQTGFLPISIVMAVTLEGARYLKARWEFSDDDFSRIWTICTLLFLGASLYAFTDNGGPARIGSFFQNPTPATQTSAGAATSRTASAMLRWLPMVLFLFVAAQTYSTRQLIPLSTVSLILRRRWKKAAKLGKPMPAQQGMNVGYPYFAVCLFAASVHPGEDNSYFWGLCVLLAWVLWARRPRRFSVVIWAGALGLALTLGFFGQHGIGRLQSYLQNLDPQWFAQFSRHRGTDPEKSKTQIGRIGRLKLSGKVVIRVEPREGNYPPEYLREASYRLYGYNSWQAGASRDSFQAVPQETNNAAFILVPKITVAKANITCYLEEVDRESGSPTGLLPLPSGSGRLEKLPVFVLKMNSLGAVLAEGPGLVNFDVSYGPGATPDMAFNPGEHLIRTNWGGGGGWPHYHQHDSSTNEPPLKIRPDLYVPEREKAVLNQIVTNWNVPPGDRPLAMRAISHFFESNFTYSTWQELPNFTTTNTTPLGVFLTRTHSGHCEYFATATVLLLRTMGVPARYAVGYAVHEKSGEEYVVRLRDAHAWCLVWNERMRIWQDFDTTPAAWIAEEAQNASPFQKLSDAWSWIGFQVAKFRWGQSHFRQYMLIALIPVLGLLIYQIFKKQRRTRKQSVSASVLLWPGLDSDFYRIEKKLAERGLIRHPDEPLSDWLQRALADPALTDWESPLRDLLQLHYRYRFDPVGLNEADRERLRQTVDACLKKLQAAPGR